MIATVNTGRESFPCVVKWTGRRGLSAVAVTYCNTNANAGDGVEQVPDDCKVCSQCTAEIEKLRAMLRKTNMLVLPPEPTPT